MFDEIMCGFGGSRHGQAARAELSARGMTARDVHRVVGIAVLATAQAMAAALHGHHAPRRRLAELLDEAGLLAERVAAAIARRGLSRQASADAAALIAPFIARHAQERLVAGAARAGDRSTSRHRSEW